MSYQKLATLAIIIGWNVLRFSKKMWFYMMQNIEKLITYVKVCREMTNCGWFDKGDHNWLKHISDVFCLLCSNSNTYQNTFTQKTVRIFWRRIFSLPFRDWIWKPKSPCWVSGWTRLFKSSRSSLKSSWQQSQHSEQIFDWNAACLKVVASHLEILDLQDI